MNVVAAREAFLTIPPVSVAETKQYVRLDGTDDDAAITRMIAAATLEIEQAAQIAVLNQSIIVTVTDPDPAPWIRLPIGPVLTDDIPTVTIDDVPFTDFNFVNGIRPLIAWRGAYSSLSPNVITIEYQAGFGATEGDVPPDVAQAIMDQVALVYDGRSPMDAKSLTSSPHMARIAARYRGVQL